MIRSLLKKGIGKVFGGGSAPNEAKPYPFKYDSAKKAAKPAPTPAPEAKKEAAPPPAPKAVPEPAPVAEAAPPAPVEIPDDVELLSVAELRKMLKDKGVKVRSKARKPELLDLLAAADGGGAGDEDAPITTATSVGGLDAAIVQELLDDMVRPALQADGGDIQLVKVDGMDVHVQLVGACTTCPSSIMTMKMGVEALFKEEFPGFGELIQVNG